MNDQTNGRNSARGDLPEAWNQTGSSALPGAWGAQGNTPELWSNPKASPVSAPKGSIQPDDQPKPAAQIPVPDHKPADVKQNLASALSEGTPAKADAEPTVMQEALLPVQSTAAPFAVSPNTVHPIEEAGEEPLPPTLLDPFAHEAENRKSSIVPAVPLIVLGTAVLAGGAALFCFGLRSRNGGQSRQAQNNSSPEQITEIVLSEDQTDSTQITELSPSSNPEPQTGSSESEASESETAEQTQIRSDASISEAKIVGEYNDFGAGYMFRLDLKGDYCYWTAEITEVQSDGQAYYSMVSSYELSDDYPYILGGSLTDQLSAEIIPFDEQDHPGTKYRVTWNGEEELTISPEYNPYLFTGYVATKKSDLSLRSYPNTDSAVLSKIPKDTKLDLYQSVCDGWYITCYRNKWGFVSGEYISETLGGNSPGSQTAEPWKDAYIEWLQYHAYGEGRTHYSLIDFDQNGIPELVAADKSPDVFVYDCPVVYTYANGGMIEVYQDLESGDFGEHQGWWNIYSSSLCANKKSGYYYNDYEGQQIFFRYKNNRLVLEAVFNIWQTGYDNQYIYNGYAVTEDEYNEHLQKYRNIINNGFKVKYEYDVSNVKPIRDY